MLEVTMAATQPPQREETGEGLAARLSSYRVIYVAVAVFALLYVYTVKGTEQALGVVFERRVAEALDIRDFRTPSTSRAGSSPI